MEVIRQFADTRSYLTEIPFTFVLWSSVSIDTSFLRLNISMDLDVVFWFGIDLFDMGERKALESLIYSNDKAEYQIYIYSFMIRRAAVI